jgi:hypothetical protein
VLFTAVGLRAWELKYDPPPKKNAKQELGSGHVGFVVNKAALGQVSSEYSGFPCQSFHTHHLPGLVVPVIVYWVPIYPKRGLREGRGLPMSPRLLKTMRLTLRIYNFVLIAALIGG